LAVYALHLSGEVAIFGVAFITLLTFAISSAVVGYVSLLA
jgi:hypothetical protein